jgi:uncharacterized protein YjbJ (UPF0337 family)
MAVAQRPEDNQQAATPQGGGPQTSADWDDLKGDVGEVAGAAVERGRHFLDSAREQATGYVDDRKNEAAQAVVDLANTLRESAGGFGERPNVRALVDSAADGLEQFAGTIRERSFGDILGTLEGAVRRRPAVAAVATMAAGFLVSRFIKASSDSSRGFGRQDQRPYGSGSSQGPQASGPDATGRGSSTL